MLLLYSILDPYSVPRYVWTHNKATHRNGTRTQNKIWGKARRSKTTKSSSERKCAHWIELIFSAKLHIEKYSRAFLYAISYLSISIHSLHLCERDVHGRWQGGHSVSNCYLFILDLFEIDWQRYIVFFFSSSVSTFPPIVPCVQRERRRRRRRSDITIILTLRKLHAQTHAEHIALHANHVNGVFVQFIGEFV